MIRVHMVVVGAATVRRLTDEAVEVSTSRVHQQLVLQSARDLRDALVMADLGDSEP